MTRARTATVQLDVHLIDAVQIGEFVEAKCRVVRRTHSLIFMVGELVVGDRVVATANGVWKTHDAPGGWLLRALISLPLRGLGDMVGPAAGSAR